MSVWEEHRSAQRSLPECDHAHVQRDRRLLSEQLDARDLIVSSVHRDLHAGRFQPAPDQHGRAAGPAGAGDTGGGDVGKHRLHAAGARPCVDADHGALDRCAEQHHVVVDVEHTPHLEPGVSDRLIADDEALRTIAIDGPDQSPVCKVSGHTTHDVDPRVVHVLAQHRCRTVFGVHVEDTHRALVARLYDHEQSMLRPVRRGHVLEGCDVPLHGHRPAVESDDVQGHQRVVRARLRVRDHHWIALGIGRIGDVPSLYR